MTRAKILMACGVAGAILALQACSSDANTNTEPVGGAGAAGEDSGAPDQTLEASPDVTQESATEGATPDTAPPDGALPDIIEGDALPPEKICAESEPGFDETNPGINFDFTVGNTLMMATQVGLAVGTFMKTAREDYCKPAKGLDIPVGTCTTMAAPGVIPQCASDSECAPEQKCLPNTNQNGQPIPGTENCKTPKAPLDVGQFTLTGFVTGPKTFHYNTGQHGAYTSTDSQDGQIPPAEFAFDADYTFDGALDGDAGLGAMSGTFHLPAAVTWTSPPMVDLPNMPGMKGIEVVDGQDLVLQWSGGAPEAVVTFTLSGGTFADGGMSQGQTVTCKGTNSGTFTIPGQLVTAAKLGPSAFLNMLQVDFSSKTSGATGPGITLSKVGIVQSLMLNAIKK